MSGNIPTTSTAGRGCVPDISRRPTRTLPGCTSMAVLAGMAPVGTGIHGLARTPLFPGMGFPIAHLAGASTRPSRFMVPRFFMAATMAMATLITSANFMNHMDTASNRVEDFTAPSVSVAASMAVAEGSRAAEQAAGTN